MLRFCWTEGGFAEKGPGYAIILESGERITARVLSMPLRCRSGCHGWCQFTFGMEDLGRKRQAVTLVLEVGGVDWEELTGPLPMIHGHSGAYGTSAWGFLEEMRGYRSFDPQIRSRGLNMGLQNSGNVLINAMHIFDVDALDAGSRERAMERGQKEAEFLVRYMRQNLPGFKRAFLAATAQELYVRETRHLRGLYRLTIDDLWNTAILGQGCSWFLPCRYSGYCHG